jgi:hypothetical protein
MGVVPGDEEERGVPGGRERPGPGEAGLVLNVEKTWWKEKKFGNLM